MAGCVAISMYQCGNSYQGFSMGESREIARGVWILLGVLDTVNSSRDFFTIRLWWLCVKEFALVINCVGDCRGVIQVELFLRVLESVDTSRIFFTIWLCPHCVKEIGCDIHCVEDRGEIHSIGRDGIINRAPE